MTSSQPSGSPLQSISAGDEAAEAFELLANETRLAILVALWESYEPYNEGNIVQFSELRARVGTTDSGQFNYHLDRLVGHFVESSDAGYRLSEAGLAFVRSVIAGTGIDEPTLEPSEIDASCTFCGGSVEVSYENGWVLILCTECEGLWPDEEQAHGLLAKLSLNPTGLMNRSPEEVYAAAWVNSFQHLYSMIEGICPTCSGQVERMLEVCDNHESDGRCQNCGRRVQTVARLHCTVCKDWETTTIGGIAKYHPKVVGFCYDHDLKLQYGFNKLTHIKDRLERATSDVEKLSDDPPRVRVTTELDGDEIWIDIDENLNVMNVNE